MNTFKSIEEVYNYMDYVLWYWVHKSGVKVEECYLMSNAIGLYITLKRNFTNTVFLRVGTVNLKGGPNHFTRVWNTIMIDKTEYIIDISELYKYRTFKIRQDLNYTVGKREIVWNGKKATRGMDPRFLKEKLCEFVRCINEEHKIKLLAF